MEDHKVYKLLVSLKHNNKMPKNIRRIPRIMTEEQISLVVETINKSTHYFKNRFGEYNRWRDKTIILLLYYCGLRPKECLYLRWEDIDFQNSLLFISPYNNKERNDTPAILTEPAKKVIVRYKNFLKENQIYSEFLFSSLLTGKPMATDTFAKRFQNIVKEAGLSKVEYYTDIGKPVYTFNPYTMRHSFCTKVYNKTKDVEAVTQLARHTRPESAHTYIHLSHPNKKQIADEVFE